MCRKQITDKVLIYDCMFYGSRRLIILKFVIIFFNNIIYRQIKKGGNKSVAPQMKFRFLDLLQMKLEVYT